MADETNRRDQNFVPTISGVSSEDIEDTIIVRIDPITKEVLVKPALPGFELPPYDDIKLTDYDGNGNPGVVTYYNNSIVVAILTLTYSGANLTDVQRS